MYNHNNKEIDFSAITEIGKNVDKDDEANEGEGRMGSCYKTLEATGLSKQPEILLYENNGIFQVTNPPCVVVIADQTMIIGWRGSTTAMDWDRDFGFYISSSFRWQNVAKVVKVQGAYISMIDEFMATNEELILQTIKEKNITEIILTGHSLAGGVAQVGHLWIEGSMNSDYRPTTTSYPGWEELYGKVIVRTIAFEAPMTTVYLKSPTNDLLNQKGIEFIQKCGANMCTTCYQMDVVPHCYGEMNWAFDLINNIMEADEQNPDNGLLEKGFLHLVDHHLNKFIDTDTGILTNGFMAPYTKAGKMFQHIGTIIYYENHNAKPKVYIDDITTVVNNIHVNNELHFVDFYSTRNDNDDDDGNDNDTGSTRTLLPEFRTMKYVKSGDTADDAANIAYRNHMYMVKGPGLSLTWQSWFKFNQYL